MPGSATIPRYTSSRQSSTLTLAKLVFRRASWSRLCGPNQRRHGSRRRSTVSARKAKGILMARQGCTAEQALQLLVGMSQRAHIKLREVASDLVETARDQAARGPGPGRH